MTENEKYISLKEAAEISGYSADYVGQLIRQGKLPGKQVFSHVSWMTTEDAVRAYIEEKGKVSLSKYGAFQALKDRYVSVETAIAVSRALLVGVTVVVSILSLIALIMFVLAFDNRLQGNAFDTSEYAR